MNVYRLLTAAILPACLLMAPDYCCAMNPGEILRQAIEQRYSWSSAEVDVQLYSDGQPNSCWQVVIHHDKMKGTMVLGRRDGGQEDAITLCHNCYADDTTIRYEAGSEDVMINDGPSMPRSIGWVPDPRMLGLTPGNPWIQHGIHIDSYFSEEITRDLIPSDDIIDGQSCIRLSRHTPATALDVWIDEERSTVVRVQLASLDVSPPVVEVATTSYRDFDGYWLPYAIDQSVADTAGNVQETNRIEFTWKSIGQPPDDGAFEIAEFTGIVAGALVHWAMPESRPSPFGENAVMRFNGTNVVAEYPEDVVEPPTTGTIGQPGKRVPWIIWANATVIFAVALWWMLRSRARTGN